MIVKLLTEHRLEFLSLKGACRGSSESTLVKMPHCWKSHALAQIILKQSPMCIHRPFLKLQDELRTQGPHYTLTVCQYSTM